MEENVNLMWWEDMKMRRFYIDYIVIILILMPSKTNKKEKKNCTEHSLMLKPKNNFCHYAQTLNIDFCKKAISSGRGKKIETSCFEGPVFNKDRNSQTPTFIIASERVNRSIFLEDLWTKRFQKWDRKQQSIWCIRLWKKLTCNLSLNLVSA